jgi:hypothetical protein
MRTTRIEVLHNREKIPLVVRARFERTFFGLGAFAATVLLVGGGYLMTEALIDPIGASDMAVLTAGFVVALEFFAGVPGAAATKNRNREARAGRPSRRAMEGAGANGLWPRNGAPADPDERIAEHPQALARADVKVGSGASRGRQVVFL